MSVLALSLGACAGGGFLSKPAPPAYDLTAPRAMVRTSSGGRGQLIVAEPTGVSVLDSEKVVVRTAAGEISTLPNAQWSDRLPRLMQARLLQAFENANRARVGRPGERLASDYQLITDMRAFQISVAAATTADVEIAAKLVADRSGRILAARIFHVRVPLGGTDTPAAMAALDEAFGRAASELVAWANRIV